MEEKSQVDFFKFISTLKIHLNLLETALVSYNNLDYILVTDESRFIKKKPAKYFTAIQYLQKIIEENEAKSKYSSQSNPKLCILYRNGTKQLCSESKLKEYVTQRSVFRSVDCIQKLSNYIDAEKVYKAKAVYMNKTYTTSFTLGKAAISDPLTVSNMMDVMTVLVGSLENAEIKRVVQIELDFIKNYDGSLWLMGCNKCLLVEACYTLIQPIKAEEDIGLLAKNIPRIAKIRPPAKKSSKSKYYLIPSRDPKEENKKYTFLRGQLRNTASNLNTPIRFTTPPLDEVSDHLTNTQPLKFNSEFKNKKLKSVSQIDFVSSPTSEPSSTSTQSFKTIIKRPISNLIESYLDNSKNSSGEKSRTKKETVKKLTETPKSLSNNDRVKERSHLTLKTLPKLNPIPPKQTYGKNFIELVLKTYYKDHDFPQGEFGMGPDISTEDFSRLINCADRFNMDSQDLSPKYNHLLVKPVLEESYLSRTSTPCGRLPPSRNENKEKVKKNKKKEETLANTIKKMNKKTMERMSIILTSPRARLSVINRS